MIIDTPFGTQRHSRCHYLVGVLIKGDTSHFEYISEAVSSGIMSVSLQTSTPIIFGVLTCATEEQVEAHMHHGTDYGKTAVEMALLQSEVLGSGKKRAGMLEAIGFAHDAQKKDEKRALRDSFECILV
jgi:6,7-dimethyl-8-ribityllumazine synthase